MQVKDTGSVIKNKLKKLLSELRGSKFVTTLVLMFKRIESKKKTWTFLFKLKSKIIINESDIDDVLESIYSKITSKQKAF